MRIALLICRLFVGITFITYGVVKLLGGQFHHGDFEINSRTTDGTSMVWCFFGYSPVYARFIGLCELVPGILVLIPRTATLGALALLAISLNLTVMDFCFAFPAVKYFALVLTILSGLLVASDYRKLKLLFWDKAETPQDRKIPQLSGATWALLILVGLGIALPFVNLLAVEVTPRPDEAALAYFMAEGWDKSQLHVRKWNRTAGDFGLNMEAEVEMETVGQNPPTVFRVRVQRPNGFVAWRAVQSERLPSAQLPAGK